VIAAVVIAYSVVLELVYRDFIAPRFGYLGYHYQEPDRFWQQLSVFVLIVLGTTLPRILARASDIVVWMLFSVVVIPIGTVPFYGSRMSPEQSFGYALFCAVVLFVVARGSAAISLDSLIKVRNGSSRWFWGLVIAFTIVTYVYSFSIFGFKFELLGLFEVVSTRLEYRDEVAPTAPALGYLISNQGNVINPLLMSIGVLRRRWLMVGAGVFGQLLLYSVTGFKTAVLSIAACILVTLLMRYRSRIGGLLMLTGVVALAWVSVLVDSLLRVGAVDIVVNRMLITAGHLTPYFIQVFSESGWAYWAYSFMAPFISNPYSVSPGFYVSTMILGRPDVQSNANLFADGYANLGHIGVLIEAAFLLLVLLILNSASRRVPVAVVLPTLIVPSFALANGSPFTAFLSFGFALAAVMFALYPREASDDAHHIGASPSKFGPSSTGRSGARR